MTLQQQWYALIGLVQKEISRWLRIWLQCFLPPAITMSLYFLIFGHVIGSHIGTMAGIPYLRYILPGLVMMSVITNAYSNVVHSVFVSKMIGYIQELWVSPMAHMSIILGYVISGTLRGLITSIIVMCIGWLFTGIHLAHPGLALITVISSAALFSAVGLINGLYAKSFDGTSVITTFILTPLIYLGGVFYTLDRLPPFWHRISEFNPIYYVVELFRYAVVGELTGHDSYLQLLAFVWIIIIAVCLFCLWMIKTGVGTRN